MSKRKHCWTKDPRPPDVIVNTERGKVGLFFRPKDAPSPENYHIAVPDKKRVGWVVYILFFILILSCILWGLTLL